MAAEVEGSPLVGAEVDLEVSGRSAAEAAGESGELGLLDLMELLWKDVPHVETGVTCGVRRIARVRRRGAALDMPCGCRG